MNYGKKVIQGVEVKPVNCKSALSSSLLEADYSLNPYIGCLHGCIYCYGPCVIKEERKWGQFLDVKINLPKILSKEAKNIEKNIIRLGSVTDPYQMAEEEYRVTRRCLKQLSKHDCRVLIQTKSDLVKRDIDLLKDMKSDIGITITSLDEDFRKKFEPGAPSISDRLSAIKELKKEGIKVWVFIGPLLPYLNDEKEELIRLKDTLTSLGVDEIYLDKLNMRERIWEKIKPLLEEDILNKYENIYFGDEGYFRKNREIYDEIGKRIF